MNGWWKKVATAGKTPKSGSWFDPSVWTFKSYDVNGKYNEQDIEELDD
jgi:hypothetical protein